MRVHEPRDPTACYTVYGLHAGRTLAQWLADGRHGVVHRVIRPDNLHLGDDGQWRVLDLGAAVSGSEPRSLRPLHAGTPS